MTNPNHLVSELTDDEHERNNLPDVLARWRERGDSEIERSPTEQSFCVPKADIAASGYDLSINRYRQVESDEVEYPTPSEALNELLALEEQILRGLRNLEVGLMQ